METIKNKTICVLPWLGITMAPNGDLFPCCHAMVFSPQGFANIKEDSLDLLYNKKSLQDIRQQMLSGEKIDFCKKCYDDEDKNVPSLRENVNAANQDFLNEVITNDNVTSDIKQIQYRDYRFSNLCNLKCRTCNAESSSSWYQDAKKLNLNTNSKVIINALENKTLQGSFFDQDFKNTKEIYFAGGEPLLHEEHYRLLHKLIGENLTAITLRYSTNLTTLKYLNENVLKLWPSFKRIDLLVSLDAPSELSSIIRYPSNQTKIIKNLKLVKLFCPSIKTRIAITISCLNVFHVSHLILELIKHQIIISSDDIELSLVYNPSYYSLDVLSTSEFTLLKDKMINDDKIFLENFHLDFRHEFKKIIQYNHQPKLKSRRDFFETGKKINTLRKESYELLLNETTDEELFKFICPQI